MNNNNIDVEKMAEEIIFWRRQFNTIVNLNNKSNGTQEFTVEEGTVKDIISKYAIHSNIPDALKFSDNEIPIEKVTPVQCNFDTIELNDDVIDLSKE